ncbi:YafY family protein [Pelagibius sp.]|uniref:helix-turn-helix transcriptional regulator n=1 Tax=Pelagibius sp. TaxID=1931238 RepID=UPI002606DE22|nr:YafY family protein [Pelagibius sp.]
MRRSERLFRIVNEMRSRGVSRAADLAAHFEVSVTTIYRDIAHLQASGLPIDGEAGIGYLLRPGFDLPNVTFTHDQVDALAVGLSFVERTGDPVLASAAREARAKIQASMPAPEERKLADAPFYSLQPKRGASQDNGLLREAIRNQRVVEIVYKSGEGNLSRRRVRPLVIWDLPDGWMVSGWCELREGFRTFRWDRITELTKTEDRFEEDEETGLIAFMELERCHA